MEMQVSLRLVPPGLRNSRRCEMSEQRHGIVAASPVRVVCFHLGQLHAISLLSQELSPISWKNGRPASANTSEAPFRRRDYLSNALWLLFLAFGPLVREVQNWPTVLRYYLCRYRDPAVAIRFRNHDVLVAPWGLHFSKPLQGLSS